ncbi:MAG TPA: hypothetical protein ENN30_02450 [Candidatus Woesearchaeota archaeon]|nr:hypothetical protein [Candidatus Woesearchaeota archaeon]
MEKIRELRGEVFCYESEDLEKVKKAFELVFPKSTTKISSTQGVYGTKVIILRAKVPKKQLKEAVRNIIQKVQKDDMAKLLRSLKPRMDETGNLFLRFNKQTAFEKEKLVLADESEDTIQVVIAVKAYPASVENYIESVKNLISKPDLSLKYSKE